MASEVEVSCFDCDGGGCVLCKGTGRVTAYEVPESWSPDEDQKAVVPPEEAAATEAALEEERRHLSYRDESSAAGVVTKRIDRVDGCSEVSFYAIGPKRERHAEAVADRERFAGGSWTYCSDRLPTEDGEFEAMVCLSEHWPRRRMILRHLVTDHGNGHDWMFPGNGGLYVYAWRPITDDPPPLRPKDHAYLIEKGVPSEWMKGEDR